MKTDLGFSHVRVHAGESTRFEIEVTNDQTAIDGVTAIVDGINPEWVRLERPLVSLFPEARDVLVVHLDVPRHCRAGDYLIDVRVVSAVDASRETSHDFWLTVEPRVDLDLDIRPSIIRCGRHGVVTATLRNTGNCGTEVDLTSEEPSRQVSTAIVPPVVSLPHEHVALVDVDLRGKRPWFGEPATRPVVVRARAGDREVERTVTFIQKPWIPRGAATALILAAIVALWAFIFLWVVSAVRTNGDPAKAVPIELHDDRKEIFTGAPNIPLSLIRGTVEGTVTASTNGAGIPAVTVEAFRIKRFPIVPGEPVTGSPTTLVSVASGATDEDGLYALRTLVPGDYVLRFSEPGYGEVWYPGTFASGQKMTIGARETDRGNDVVMIGRTGTVSVQLDLPDGVDPTTLTARITPVDSLAAPAANPIGFRRAVDDGSTGGTCVVSPTGLVTCSGVPTPGEYTISVSGPGFDPQRIDVTLAGGADTVVDTVQLAGEPAGISGSVVDQDGAAIVGARVTVSAGLFSVRVFTDRGGRFTVDDLPTPADYVVDIAQTGYVGRTVSIPLQPGIDQVLPTQQLVGGVGAVSGEVVDATGARLPGVEVQISGSGASARTTTLTDGAIGSFLVRDLAVPATYSVSFVLPGYVTETRVVTFDGAGEQTVGTVVMSTGLGTVEGTVVDPTGTPITNAKVELRDGVRTRTTTTSTASGGAFAFADVAPGPYSIVVSSTSGDDVALWVGQRDVVAGETVRLSRIVLPVSGLGAINGVVTGVDGLPIGQVGVSVADISGGTPRTTSTASAGVALGSYNVTGLDVPGTYLVTYTLTDYATATLQVDLAFGNGGNIVTRNVALVPDPGTVSGTVRNTAALPVVGAIVDITARDGTVLTGVTDASGRFTIAGVPAGTGSITVVTADGTGTTTITFLVPAGGGDVADPIVVDALVPATTTTTTTATTTTLVGAVP